MPFDPNHPAAREAADDGDSDDTAEAENGSESGQNTDEADEAEEEGGGEDESASHGDSENTDEDEDGEVDGDEEGDEVESAADEVDEADELAALESSDDPRAKAFVKKYRKLQGAFTRRTQGNAQARRLFESLQNPVLAKQTIEYLAQQHGLQIGGNKKEQAKAEDEINAELEAMFGPEVAPRLGGVVSKLVQKLAADQLKPVLEGQERMQEEAAQTQTQEVLRAFSREFPDWKKHERAMFDLGQKIQLQPNSNMTQFEYMEMLYSQVTRSGSKSKTTKEVVERIKRGAGKTEPRPRGVPPSRVGNARPKSRDIRRLISDSMDGKVYDDARRR